MPRPPQTTAPPAKGTVGQTELWELQPTILCDSEEAEPVLEKTTTPSTVTNDASLDEEEEQDGDVVWEAEKPDGWSGMSVGTGSESLGSEGVAASVSVSAQKKVTQDSDSPVRLHIYDVSQRRAIQRLNKVLSSFGGAFHVGVEVRNHELSFGAEGMSISSTPGLNWEHHFRQIIDLRPTALSTPQIEQIIRDMSPAYGNNSYDLLTRNCCHFADDFCQRLGVGPIPPWIGRLARAGASVPVVRTMARKLNVAPSAGKSPTSSGGRPPSAWSASGENPATSEAKDIASPKVSVGSSGSATRRSRNLSVLCSS